MPYFLATRSIQVFHRTTTMSYAMKCIKVKLLQHYIFKIQKPILSYFTVYKVRKNPLQQKQTFVHRYFKEMYKLSAHKHIIKWFFCFGALIEIIYKDNECPVRCYNTFSNRLYVCSRICLWTPCNSHHLILYIKVCYLPLLMFSLPQKLPLAS